MGEMHKPWANELMETEDQLHEEMREEFRKRLSILWRSIATPGVAVHRHEPCGRVSPHCEGKVHWAACARLHITGGMKNDRQ